jgi:hypothetical protein
MPRKRRQQLVSQMLEKLDASALEQYEHIIRRYTRGRDGVYALYLDDSLYYVGLARNLQGRLKQHLKDRHKGSWNHFSVYLTIGHSFVKEMETLLLRIAKPEGNKHLGKFVQCQDLHRSFRHDYKADAEEKFGRLVGHEKVGKARHAKPVDEGGPVLGSVIKKGLALRARYKRREYKARVLKSGLIKFQGKTFKSPSGAGFAVRGKSTDGWQFWRYERAPGDWVPLNELRKHPWHG